MKTIRYISAIIALIFACRVSSVAQVIPAPADPSFPVGISDISAERTDDNFYISYTLHLSSVRLGSEKQLAVTPVLLDSIHRVTLPGAIVSGRTRYIRDRRDGIEPEGYTIFRSGKADTLPVQVRLPYADWMLDATLVLTDTISGCSCRPTVTGDYLAATIDMRPHEFVPDYDVYITSVAAVEKIRHADGHAFIDFPVNKSQIYPDYRRNPVELANIRDTISIIKNDPDYTITSLSLRGYASPEGSYANNERLARARTEALRQYIRNLYAFPADILHASWEAEDWKGLIAWLENSDMPDREAIIELATTPIYDGNPDGREWKIKSTYPDQYRILLADVYPSLRHTDYTVSYTIRSFTTVEELRSAWVRDPRRLSLSELITLAQSYEKGSAEYVEVMETAARLFPDSPEANLNAAIPALESGDLTRAERYLSRAGQSPQATYARAILLARQGDHEAAMTLFRQAADAGVTQADDAISQLDEIIRHASR